MKILIVDDKHENLYLLESLLKGSGYETISAKNGAEAFAFALKDNFDLIISDILMPVMDGFTFCRECKKNEHLKNIPFIFYTATYTDLKDEEFALSLGADKFILKPQEPDVFIELIKEVLKNVQENKIQISESPDQEENVILREYNSTLIRKLENKMQQTEENEKKLKAYVRQLETTLTERKKVEIALKESEDRYRLLHENSLDAILLTSPDGSIFSANKAACEMFEMTEDEICRGGRDGIVDLSDPLLPILLEERNRTGKAKGDLTMLRKGKIKFPTEVSTAIYTDGAGKLKSSMIIRDITTRKRAENEIQRNEQQLTSIYNATGDVIYYIAVEANNQYRFVSVNSAFSKVTGVPSSQVAGKLVSEIIPEPSLSIVLEKYQIAIKLKDTVQWEETSNYPNGRLTGDVSIAPIFDNKGVCTHLVGSVHDITERKKSEAEILNANRQYSFISQINHMIVHTRDMNLIFDEICRISVEYGKFRMAWIGVVDNNGNVIPVAWNGAEEGYLKNINISQKDVEEGQGPTGTAIRQGTYYYCNNISNDPRMKSWRDEALKHGYLSSIALPITPDGKVIGGLTLYADKSDFFNKEEINLLEGVVSNISFALKSIETEENRKQLLENLKIKEENILRANERMQVIIEGTPHLFFYVQNSNGNIDYVSPSVEIITGYKVEQWIGQRYWFFTDSLLNEVAINRTKENLKGIVNSSPVIVELKHADGHLILLETFEKPIIKNNTVIGVQGVAHDITEKKKFERDLIEAKDIAEEMNRLKSSFLANMSHELRTPMIGILGYSEMLVDESNDQEIKEVAEIINESGHRLMNTLNMILNLSKIESGKLNFENKTVDAIKSISESCKLFEKAANKKSLSLKVETKYSVLILKIDDTMFREIFNNLINNAIKFTSHGGVTVEIFTEPSDINYWAVIKVRDTGIGISKENQVKIWEEFRQVSEGLGRSFEGTGLGLTITKKFVELMNGTITVNSQLNVGSVFTVRFPLSHSQNPEIVKSIVNESHVLSVQAKLPNGDLPYVLYVEDDSIAFKIVAKTLKSVCRIDWAANSIQAIEKANVKQYAAILMDINLGIDADGLEATRAIRKIESYKNTPIVAITAYAMSGDKEEFIQAGCSHYISKPFDKKDLINLVTSILKK